MSKPDYISFRQAIRTRYAGPTNTRGSRCIATAQAGRVTIEWDDALNLEQNHANAARALCKRFGWGGDIVGGALPDGSYCFTFADENSTIPARVPDKRLGATKGV